MFVVVALLSFLYLIFFILPPEWVCLTVWHPWSLKDLRPPDKQRSVCCLLRSSPPPSSGRNPFRLRWWLRKDSPAASLTPNSKAVAGRWGYIINYNNVWNSNTFSNFGFWSFVLLCLIRPFSGPTRSHWKHTDGASTLPRTKSKTFNSPAWSERPSISIPPAQNPDFPSTLSARRLKMSAPLHLPASEPTDAPPPLDPPPPCTFATLPVPTLRLSPSPTTLCQGTNLDGSGTRQPSPVARERRARSISILTTNIQPVSCKERSENKEERDVLESVMDVTHSALRGNCSTTYTESHRQAAGTQNAFGLSEKVDLIKDERSNVDKSETQPRKIGMLAIPQLTLNSKKQLELLSNAVTGTQTSEPEGIMLTDVRRKCRLVFDARLINLGVNLHRKHRTAQTAGFGSNQPLQEHLAAGRNAELPAAPFSSDSTEVFWNQSTVVPKLRQFTFNTAGNTDAALPSVSKLSRALDDNMKAITTGLSSGPHQHTSAAPNKTSPQKHRLRENTNTQKNVGGTLNLSSGAIKDDCFRSKSQARQESYLSESKLCLQCPDQQQTVFPAKCTISQTKCSKSDITTCYQNPHPGQNKSHARVNLSDSRSNQTAEGPAELPECSSQSCVEKWPLSVEQRSRNPNGPGNNLNGVFDLLSRPQQGVHQRVHQRAAATTLMASPSLNQPDYRRPDRANLVEEDPYYVTMFHPGSVYVGE